MSKQENQDNAEKVAGYTELTTFGAMSGGSLGPMAGHGIKWH